MHNTNIATDIKEPLLDQNETNLEGGQTDLIGTSEMSHEIISQSFDPIKTELPVIKQKNKVFLCELFRLSNDDWVCHDTNDTNKWGPDLYHYNIRTQKLIAKYPIPEFFDNHWFSSFSEMYNFNYDERNAEEKKKAKEAGREPNLFENFSAIFAMNKLGHLFMCPKVEEDLGEMKTVEPTRILQDEFKGP